DDVRRKSIGLAATQVDIHQRIIVIDVSENRDERLVLINPELLEKSGETGIEEGCLSIPEQRALVPRAEKVKIRALDRDGKPFELEADGLLAICIGLRLGNGKYCTLRLFFNQV
ncbi:TPA: peptide deformylase, partial [Escherichia coli]|nr:peptide deformylase [Escherichia coli]